MTLERLEIERVRNISSAAIDFSPGINLLHGENGSGKTSILESIVFLTSARSLRSNSTQPMIQRGTADVLVRGIISKGGRRYQVGVQRTRSGERNIRINGEKVHRATELVKVLPTLHLGPDSVDLLLGRPGLRRRFLNWGVFHVEHSFGSLWEEANRSLRQRNQALRSGASRREIETWSSQLADQGEKLDGARSAYVALYAPVFQQVALELLGMNQVEFDYFRGWEPGISLSEVYAIDLDDDIKRGHTQKGFQRADVRIRVEGQQAVKVCSRGELKALVWSMKLAQGALAKATEHHEALYLIDDLASEFDVEHRQRVCRFLARTGNQVLLTGLDKEALLTSCDGVFDTLFHVKQGGVEVQEN